MQKDRKNIIPEWTIGEDIKATRWFVHHNDYPVFVVEFGESGESGVSKFFEDISVLSENEIEEYMCAAAEVFNEYLEED